MSKGERDNQAFVADLATRHGQRLRQFLAQRLRNRADAPDLAQEIYLRLLRVSRPDEIRSPEAYLFTVAANLLHEHGARQAAAAPLIELDEVSDELIAREVEPAVHAATLQRIEALERSIRRLSARLRTTLLLHRRDGYSLEEIAARLGISRNVAKKYLAKALQQCRKDLRA